MRTTDLVESRIRSLRFWTSLAIIILCLGTALRFYHLDWKVYSFDETVTSIRASGHSIDEFLRFVDDRQMHRLADLNQFQQYDPSTKFDSTVRSLAMEEPQHAPLYFLLERGVSAVGAHTIWWRRLPSAVFAALLLPAFWLLSYELFHSRAAAWTGSALVAVSPFHVVYAQQAREYSLWALAIVLSSFCLLRALRGHSRASWIAYTFVMATSLWIYTLSVYVLLAHALFIMFDQTSDRPNRFAFLLAGGSAVLLFSPWLYAIALHSAKIGETTNWDNAKLPLIVFAEKWIFNAVAVFFDLDFVSLRYLPVAICVAIIVAVAVITTLHRANKASSQFILILGATTAIAMLVPDLLFAHSHSTQSRYLTPLWLSIELAVGYGLAKGGWRHARRSSGWRIATMFLVAAGAVSCVVSAHARFWWLASDAKTIPAIADVLNRSQGGGLIAYAGDDFYLLELSNVVVKPISFFQNGLLSSAANQVHSSVYLIGRPAQVLAEANELGDRTLIPLQLPRLFPTQDASVSKLRAEGAAARPNFHALDDVALWTVSAVR